MRVVRISMMSGILVLAAACGGGPGATGGPGVTGGPGANGTPAAAACTGSGGTQVGIADNTFNPQSATVAVGGTVTWTNADAATHTVTFNDSGPDCGRLGKDASVSQTFTAAGTFTYICAIHSSMRGSVVVQ